VVFYTGDFKDAEVFISSVDVYNDNNITLFEESVFGTMLQQMTSGKGFIYASMAINFDCDFDILTIL